MNTSTLPTTEGLKPGDLLTPMECAAIFCEKMRVSLSTYYRIYHPYIKFKGRVPRIPFEVVHGLINLHLERNSQNDPSFEELKKYIVDFKK